MPNLSQLLYICSFNVTHYKNILLHKSWRLGRYLHKDLPKPMGRWNIDYCNKKMDQKVDLSNEDHCGPCGQYAIMKTKPVEKAIIKKE